MGYVTTTTLPIEIGRSKRRWLPYPLWPCPVRKSTLAVHQVSTQGRETTTRQESAQVFVHKIRAGDAMQPRHISSEVESPVAISHLGMFFVQVRFVRRALLRWYLQPSHLVQCTYTTLLEPMGWVGALQIFRSPATSGNKSLKGTSIHRRAIRRTRAARRPTSCAHEDLS
jgi:hypothetical protein